MRAGHHVRDDFRVRRVGHRWFQHAHDRGRARSANVPRIQFQIFADDRRIAIQNLGPEPVGQHHRAGGVRAVIVRVQQPAQHRMQTHHFEIRSVHHPRAHFARLAQPDHAESHHRKIAEFLNRFHPRLQVLNFRNRERHVLDAHPRRALPNIDQPVFIAIDQRAQQHAAHHAENCRVRADSQRQRQHHGDGQPLGARQRTHRNFQIAQQQFRFEHGASTSRRFDEESLPRLAC